MARKKYQSYTEEFRREAVKPGVTQAQIAKELGGDCVLIIYRILELLASDSR